MHFEAAYLFMLPQENIDMVLFLQLPAAPQTCLFLVSQDGKVAGTFNLFEGVGSKIPSGLHCVQWGSNRTFNSQFT